MLKRLVKQAEDAKAEAERANRSKDEFLATLTVRLSLARAAADTEQA